MKKKLLLISMPFFLGALQVHSQVILDENFDATPVGLTLPAGWAQYNVDGLTVITQLAGLIGSNGYSVVGNPSNANDHEAFSTSYFNPAGGTANDWLISPQITLPAGGGILQFDAYCETAATFKLLISTASGNTVADFNSATVGINQSTSLPSGATTPFTAPLDAFAGQTIRLAFQNNTVGNGVLVFDNIEVIGLNANDASLDKVELYRYATVNDSKQMSFDVSNYSSSNITSVKVNWNDGTDHSATLSTTIAPGATVTLNHPDMVSSATVTEKDITVTITEVNGGVDGYTGNNTKQVFFNTVSAVPAKYPVLEEGTGTWCQYCPRGAVAMEYMYDNYPNFIGIAVHNGNTDPMRVVEYDAAMAFSVFPNSHIDRSLKNLGADQNTFESNYTARAAIVVPAEIGATVSISGNTVTIDASSTFKSPFSQGDNYRLGVIMTENEVHGTTSGYNQSNAYAGGAMGAMGGYENLPNPVPAAQMYYQHVGRALIGGINGQAGTVPATLTDGQTINYSFSYTVPATSVRANMQAVVVLIDQSNGEIVNAKKVDLTSVGIAETAPSVDFLISPNPTVDFVDFTLHGNNETANITIYDMNGKEMMVRNNVQMMENTPVHLGISHLPSGTYLVTIATDKSSMTKQLIKQ